MRENIDLFKGKRSPIGEWVYGGLLTWPDGTASICTQKPDDPEEKSMVGVMPDSVGEFTGKYDSTKFEELSVDEQAVFIYPLAGGKRSRSEWKGSPIFEGDICQFLNDDNETSDYEVFWRQEACQFAVRQIGMNDIHFDTLDEFFCARCKVIGNVYDRLLEV